MSAVERAVVGRKTPGDGKLEISGGFANALGGHGAALRVRVSGREEPGRVSVFACTCEKAGASGKHEHHFVQCDVFRELVVGTELRLTADQALLEVALG
jgi:hypothetical protein